MARCEVLLHPNVRILDLLASANGDDRCRFAVVDARIESPPVRKLWIERVVGIHNDQILAWRDMDEFEEVFPALILPIQFALLRENIFAGRNDVSERTAQRLARFV